MSKRLATPAAALWVCFLLNFFNYLDRQIPYALSEQLKGEFALPDADVGLLGSAFLFVYALAAPPLGLLADRLRRRWILGGCALLWSCATAASAWAPSYPVLLALRALVGIGEAGYAAAAPALLAAHYDEARRPRVFAFFFIAIPVGSAAGYAVGGAVGGWLGWRASFILSAVPGLILAPLALGLSEGEGAPEPAADAKGRRREWRRLLGNRVFWLILAGEAAISFSLQAVTVWFPSHLVRTFGYGLAAAGVLAGALVALPALAGSLAGGWLSQRSEAARPGSLLVVPALGCVAGAALAAAYFQLSDPWLAHPTILLAVLVIFLYPGPLNAAIAREAPPRLLATAFSLEILVIHLLGDVWSPQLVGALSDALQAQGVGAARALARALGWLTPAPLLVGAALLAAAVGKTRRKQMEASEPAEPGP